MLSRHWQSYYGFIYMHMGYLNLMLHDEKLDQCVAFGCMLAESIHPGELCQGGPPALVTVPCEFLEGPRTQIMVF